MTSVTVHIEYDYFFAKYISLHSREISPASIFRHRVLFNIDETFAIRRQIVPLLAKNLAKLVTRTQRFLFIRRRYVFADPCQEKKGSLALIKKSSNALKQSKLSSTSSK